MVTALTTAAYRTRRHMWVEFVVGSSPCPERFFSGYSGFLFSSKSNILNYFQALYHEPPARRGDFASTPRVIDIK